MIDTTRYFIIIFFVIIFLAFIASYFWLSKVARFENRKKEIAIGFITCALAVMNFMFLPILFSRINLKEIGTQIFDSIQFAEFAAEDSGLKLNLVPFIRPFVHFLAASSQKYIRFIVVFVPALIASLIILFTVIIIFKIREPKNNTENKNNRKQLFEYDSEIITKLNKKK